MTIPSDDPALPRQSAWLFRWFVRYCRRFLRKHFHGVRLSHSSAAVPAENGAALIFVMNHPSWWDVIIGALLCGEFPTYRHYAPIAAHMLPKYRIFSRLGFFGVDQSPRGAARFVRTTKAIFEQPFRALWITAQGKFVDPRVRPTEIEPGAGFVASRLSEGFVIPVAMEYPFWNERSPEALIRFGAPLDLSQNRGLDGRAWTSLIERALEQTQDALAAEAMSREPAAFRMLVSGEKTGVGSVHGWWRRLTSRLRGQKFDAAHGVDAKVESGRA